MIEFFNFFFVETALWFHDNFELYSHTPRRKVRKVQKVQVVKILPIHALTVRSIYELHESAFSFFFEKPTEPNYFQTYEFRLVIKPIHNEKFNGTLLD